MANELLQCSVVTPEKEVVSVQAVDVVLPAHDGLLGVLPGHAPLLCNLGTGILSYQDSDNSKQTLFVDGGFGHIHNNQVTLLTREAIKPGEVSLSQAEEFLTQAQAKPKSSLDQATARTRAIARAHSLIALAQG
jgi:F-type H+-transporting ATPase subunit epsilon